MNPRGNLKYVYNNINRIEFQKGPENHIQQQPPLPALKVDQDDDLTYSGNEPLKGSSSTAATITTTAPTSTLPKSTTARATTFTAEEIAKMTTQEVIDYILGKKSISTRKSALAAALNLENSGSTKVAKDKVGTEDVISYANESVKASSTKTETEELTPTMKSKTTQTGGDEQQQQQQRLYQHQLQHEQVQDQQQRLMHFWI